jgi:hypothetical protein
MFLEKIKIQTITILNDSLSEIIRNMLSEILNAVMKNGWILLVSGLALIVLSNLVHYIKKYGKTEEKTDSY